MQKPKSLWKIFTSMKLGVTLLIIISIVSIIGTVIPQNDFMSHNKWVKLLQLNNLYYSWWYLTLLGILMLNLVACSIQRYKPIIKKINAIPKVKAESQIKSLKHHKSLRLDADLELVKKSTLNILANNKYNIITSSKDKEFLIGAEKAKTGYLGSLITHISFVIILIGAMYGGLYGYKGYINAPVGTTFTLQDVILESPGLPAEDFQVKVDKFWVEEYENGTPSGYFSQLTLLENGKKIRTEILAVNDPLTNKGVRFYQSTYGTAISYEINDGRNKIIQKGAEPEGSNFEVKNTDYTVVIYRYLSEKDFKQMHSSGQPIMGTSGGPYVVYVLYKGNERIGVNSVELNEIVEIIPDEISLKFTETIPFTGLLVKKDPGVPIVMLGFILLILGLMLSFFIQPRYIWVVINETNGATIITLGGRANRNQLAFKEHIAFIIANIEQDIMHN